MIADPVVMSKARGRAKRDLIAQAAVVARELSASAERIRGHIHDLKEKTTDEWTLVESIHNEIFTLPHELNLTALVAKLVAFQLTDAEARRTMIGVGREMGVFVED